MVNNPILYAAIVSLCLVALPCLMIVSSVSGIVCLAVPAAVRLLILGIFGSHYNSSVCSVMSRLQNVKSQYQYVCWKLLTAELLDLGAISPTAEMSGFLEY